MDIVVFQIKWQLDRIYFDDIDTFLKHGASTLMAQSAYVCS